MTQVGTRWYMHGMFILNLCPFFYRFYLVFFFFCICMCMAGDSFDRSFHLSGNPCTARPENGAHPGKAIYIQLIGSCAVTNLYTSEAQSSARTSHFGIGWDILEGRAKSWGSLSFNQNFLNIRIRNTNRVRIARINR
jgi:hypothetical protein